MADLKKGEEDRKFYTDGNKIVGSCTYDGVPIKVEVSGDAKGTAFENTACCQCAKPSTKYVAFWAFCADCYNKFNSK